MWHRHQALAIAFTLASAFEFEVEPMVEAAADPEVREAAVPYSLANPARNVLYLVFDDLRPDLSFYGADWMDTPHLQRLAESGTAFDRAYSQQTVCSP